MLNPSKILYISDYDFGDEHPLRNKFIVVVHNIDQKVVLVSLTTSQCHIPEDLIKEGCIQEADRMIHSFYFPKDKVIAENGFCFEKDTFIDINRHQVFEREIEHLNAKYIETGKTEEKCTLLPEFYLELLYCIYKSKFIPKKTKLSIEPVIEELSKESGK